MFDQVNAHIRNLITDFLNDKGHQGYKVNPVVVAPSIHGDYQIIGTKSLKRYFDKAATEEFIEYVNDNLPKGVNHTSVTSNKKSIHINLHLDRGDFVENFETDLPKVDTPLKILVDYPSPNTAKVLHIGHIRSIIIGDCVANFLEEVGHDVTRVSHDGDFGTQFGMIINYILTETDGSYKSLDMATITDYYCKAKVKYDSDNDFKVGAQSVLTHIQRGTDETVTAIWNHIIEMSQKYCYGIFKRMHTSDSIQSVGESFYAKFWPQVRAELDDLKLIEDSDGAKVIFVKGYNDPLMVEKSNGCLTYDTTDIIALWYRVKILGMNQVIYLTDSGQNSHFKKLFKLADHMGWLDRTTVNHIGFGKVYKPDGMLIRTRDAGSIIRLEDIINTVVEKCEQACVDHNRPTDSAELMAINSMRYFEMVHPYNNSYNFDLDAMTHMNSDSGLYTMYTYARMMKIIDSSKKEFTNMSGYELTKCEGVLVSDLVSLELVVKKITKSLEVSKLNRYLARLCTDLNSYYSEGKILGDDNEEKKVFILKKCLGMISKICDILGIELVDSV